MSHALLLRLFLSQSFFSVHVALRYLKLYADNIGITYYLTRRLRELDPQDLRDVWGFICHLLVTRPSKSRALECFVGHCAQKSTHIAMLTLWFMQAALKDMAYAKHETKSFIICQRVLHQCHEIIFGDLPPPAPTPYASLDVPFQSRFLRRKIKPHAEPAFVGMGLILAGVPAMPILTEIVGEVAIEQGRTDDDGTDLKSLAKSNDAIVHAIPPDAEQRSNDDGDEEMEFLDSPQDNGASDSVTARDSVFDGPAAINTKPLPHRKTVSAAQTLPALPLHLREVRRSRFSEDPLSQMEPEAPPTMSPCQSSPSLTTVKSPLQTAALNRGEDLLQNYDTPSQIHLLRGHYCRSEVQFLLTLENISTRLLVVPKPARVSALRAELTSLNHKLPAEICMPMWCSSSDAIRPRQVTQPHHRIVRVPPGESVVLNSAERAPYLLLIEILHDDLDFDPSKRANKGVLRKIVLKEEERKGASKDLIPFKPAAPVLQAKSRIPSDGEKTQIEDEAAPSPVVVVPATPMAVSPTVPADEEEMDLVEQLYGADHSLRSCQIDLTESIVLPPAPKNRELDMVTWSRPRLLPTAPLSVDRTSFGGISSTSDRTGASSSLQPPQSLPNGHREKQALSMDEYSERMRTAAIMLAQLNANLIREPVTPIGAPGLQSHNLPEPHQLSGALSWLPGSSWLTSGEPPQPIGRGPVHPSLTRSVNDATQSATTRMRLQPAEAAAIRERIMKEMLALEEERMERMREHREGESLMYIDASGSIKSAEDEGIIKRELNKVDPSSIVFSESWAAKKSRIRHSSPYGHLANWDCVSVIVKTGGDLRQEQLAVQLIQQFERIWKEENCQCWVRYFRILITGGSSGLVETITDAVSIHSIKKAEYARRLADGRFGHVTLLDHFKSTYGDPSSAKFVRAQRNFAKSLAGYSIVTYLLQIKDRHNGNILLDRDGHLIHIDFGFMLSNSPGNIGFEAAPFKFPTEYLEVLGGIGSAPFLEFKRLFREGFEAARKHCDSIITLVELMQKDSTLPCFAAFGEQTASQLRERFQPALTHSLVGEYVDRLIEDSLGSNWTRLYDSFQYYSQSIL